MLMKTDIIEITSGLEGREEALRAAERFNQYNKFKGKSAMHIRLLTEELICAVHGIMDELKADLWFESDFYEDGVLCRICLSAKKAADPSQEKHLLSVSSSGKNENARGILGMIREAFRVSMQYSKDGVYMEEYTRTNSWYNMGAQYSADGSADTTGWSLNQYRESVREKDSGENWDELERSVIASIADNVCVWLKKDRTEIVIERLIKGDPRKPDIWK